MSRLTGKQRRYLRALGQRLAATLHVGHDGVTDAVVGQADAQLTAHELIKVRVSENAPQSRHDIGDELARRTNAELAQVTAFRNGSLQGGYFILAARALGLDCGPMSGFDNATLDAEFFADGRWKSNFLCNLGYGDASKLHPRNPRPSFEEACRIF